jgi:hypothetical protein
VPGADRQRNGCKQLCDGAVSAVRHPGSEEYREMKNFENT